MRLALLNMAIPVMVTFWPFSWLALAPVIWIEWLVVRRRPALAGAAVGKAVAWANVASSIVGVPIACIAWMFLGDTIEDQFFSYPNRLPPDHVLAGVLSAGQLPQFPEKPWIALVVTLLLVPCFAVSVLIEYWVCRAFWKGVPAWETLRSVSRMNLASYAFLVVVVVALTFIPGFRW